jgi:hypothetical protein
VRPRAGMTIANVKTDGLALFRVIDWSDVKWPTGRTDRDKISVMTNGVAIALPYEKDFHVVIKDSVTWTNGPLRSVPDSEKASLFARIEDAISRALATYRCDSGFGRDILADIAQMEIIPDSVALATLEAADVDPAAFDDIRLARQQGYDRGPDWGNTPCDLLRS